ncbi:uncharacterized protein LOC117501936 isoform X2 [Thalassophryne amazonica]|uniref:uncharacterized protein LOC117501936 isoform X2 n=1 Tax=Thalassophryne amazonica TaxID=390379 RepID=UPI0014717C1F|nr:uncharacterized protein LOC117501936 isoform X2 [Thalassophryne amazonica]
MNSTAGTAPPVVVIGLDVVGPWHQRGAEKSLVQTRVLSGSVHLPPAAGGHSRTPLRLPSLSSAARGTQAVRLSLSEPSLRSKVEWFSSCHSAVSQMRPPPPTAELATNQSFHPCDLSPPCPTQQNQHQIQSTYKCILQAVQPGSKLLPPPPLRRHSHNASLSAELAQADLRPLALRYRSSSSHPRGELLFVTGKSCLPTGTRRPPRAGPVFPARTQLHVFLPGESEEADSDSVDEGFMDELDSKVLSVKLQRVPPRTTSQCAHGNREKCM